MIYYIYNPNTGAYLGDYDAQESPLEPGSYISPTYSTALAPSTTDTTRYSIRWDGFDWQIYELVPTPVVLELRPLNALEIRLKLNALGLRDAIENYVQSSSIDVQDYWLFSTIYLSTDTLFTSVLFDSDIEHIFKV